MELAHRATVDIMAETAKMLKTVMKGMKMRVTDEETKQNTFWTVL